MSEDIALALSGGGYRAAHFHLGVLRKLHTLGLLERVKLISSVSGGSILASLYVASRLRNESFDQFENSALQLLGRPVPLDLAVARDFVPFTSSGAGIAKVLTRYLEHNGRAILLEDLARVSPQLVLNCTNIRTGAGWRFTSDVAPDGTSRGTGTHWEIGTALDEISVHRYFTYRCTGVALAQAVTASAAFPVFSAVKVGGRIDPDPIDESKADPHSRYLAHPIERRLIQPLLLSDGGVRDNTGVTSVIAGISPSDVPYVIVSDAGVEAAPIYDQETRREADGVTAGWITEPDEAPRKTIMELMRQITSVDKRGRVRKLSYLKRQFDLRGRHNNQMTTLLALSDYLNRPSKRGIAVFRIDRTIEDSDGARKKAARLSSVKTRLRKLNGDVGKELQDHGAQLLWHRLTRYVPDLLAEQQRMPGVEPKHPDAGPVQPRVLS